MLVRTTTYRGPDRKNRSLQKMHTSAGPGPDHWGRQVQNEPKNYRKDRAEFNAVYWKHCAEGPKWRRSYLIVMVPTALGHMKWMMFPLFKSVFFSWKKRRKDSSCIIFQSVKSYCPVHNMKFKVTYFFLKKSNCLQVTTRYQFVLMTFGKINFWQNTLIFLIKFSFNLQSGISSENLWLQFQAWISCHMIVRVNN